MTSSPERVSILAQPVRPAPACPPIPQVAARLCVRQENSSTPYALPPRVRTGRHIGRDERGVRRRPARQPRPRLAHRNAVRLGAHAVFGGGAVRKVAGQRRADTAGLLTLAMTGALIDQRGAMRQRYPQPSSRPPQRDGPAPRASELRRQVSPCGRDGQGRMLRTAARLPQRLPQAYLRRPGPYVPRSPPLSSVRCRLG